MPLELGLLVECYLNCMVIPCLKYFEKARNKIRTGNVRITEAAYNGPGRLPMGLNWVVMSTLRVCICMEGAINISHISSDHLPRKIDRNTMIEIVLQIGNAMVKAIRTSLAPSILADSKMEVERVLK